MYMYVYTDEHVCIYIYTCKYTNSNDIFPFISDYICIYRCAFLFELLKIFNPLYPFIITLMLTMMCMFVNNHSLLYYKVVFRGHMIYL